jgi:hypothetical protein
MGCCMIWSHLIWLLLMKLPNVKKILVCMKDDIDFMYMIGEFVA